MHIDFLRGWREQKGKESAGTGKGKGKLAKEADCIGTP